MILRTRVVEPGTADSWNTVTLEEAKASWFEGDGVLVELETENAGGEFDSLSYAARVDEKTEAVRKI